MQVKVEGGPGEDPLEYHRDTYGVPAYIGVRVMMGDKPGVITGACGPHILIQFDGEDISKPCHPEWAMEYLIPQHAGLASVKDPDGVLAALQERLAWARLERKALDNPKLGPPTDNEVGVHTLVSGVLDVLCLSIPYAVLYLNPPEGLYLTAFVALLAVLMGVGVTYSWVRHYRLYRLKRVNAALRWLNRRLS